ncbi:hypothetical protein BAUCODRAFT_125750 [Baudoinia panamericana UAMH 10762]|uniref:Uncharacterized protein n=1 Tax=Baudoinia panamericana (strain UAMH 10762) TaxID=717646 RepID=M2M8P6_BAUPA|nr:uncharacterized protein BAUCODRAFT_125750 [Baudoinia panamericana UAMH 10762]EMC92776.1 hypothetical protein BAUCODRAFT_125750 [Baudoinia panamericana UAMH 10762]
MNHTRNLALLLYDKQFKAVSRAEANLPGPGWVYNSSNDRGKLVWTRLSKKHHDRMQDVMYTMIKLGKKAVRERWSRQQLTARMNLCLVRFKMNTRHWVKSPKWQATLVL